MNTLYYGENNKELCCDRVRVDDSNNHIEDVEDDITETDAPGQVEEEVQEWIQTYNMTIFINACNLAPISSSNFTNNSVYLLILRLCMTNHYVIVHEQKNPVL